MDIVKYISSYTMAFIIAQILLNYILKLPHKITGNSVLINEYYIDNIKTSIILDYFLILFYLAIAYIIIYFANINDYAMKIRIVSITSLILSLSAIKYILSHPKNNSFFSRLFYDTGYNLSVNDVIMVVSTFILTTFITDIYS